MDRHDPMYLAGFNAGLQVAAAVLEGRASMAREMARNLDAAALEAASKHLLDLRFPVIPPTKTAGEGQ